MDRRLDVFLDILKTSCLFFVHVEEGIFPQKSTCGARSKVSNCFLAFWHRFVCCSFPFILCFIKLFDGCCAAGRFCFFLEFSKRLVSCLSLFLSFWTHKHRPVMPLCCIFSFPLHFFPRHSTLQRCRLICFYMEFLALSILMFPLFPSVLFPESLKLKNLLGPNLVVSLWRAAALRAVPKIIQGIWSFHMRKPQW